MVFYFIVGVERVLAPGWIAAAKSAPTPFAGFVPTITLTMSVVLFCTLAEPEKLAGNIFAGQPQFTGHDITNSYMPYVAAGVSVATNAASIAAGGGGGAMGAVFNSFRSGGGGTPSPHPPLLLGRANSQSTPPPRRNL